MTVQWGVVIGVSLAASIWDLRTGRIPNLLNGLVALGGVGWGLFAAGLAGLGDSVVGCLLAAFPYVLLFVFAGAGAGDAKLMGALGAWLGITGALLLVACVAVVGALAAVIVSLLRGQFMRVTRQMYITTVGALAAGLGWGSWEHVARPPETAQAPLKLRYAVAVLAGVSTAAAMVVFLKLNEG